MSDWNQPVLSYTIPAMRSGWHGLWDHFISLVRKQDPLLVPKDMTISFYLKETKSSVYFDHIEIVDDDQNVLGSLTSGTKDLQ